MGIILPITTMVLDDGAMRRTSKVFLSRSPTILSVTMLLAKKKGNNSMNGIINPYIISTKYALSRAISTFSFSATGTSLSVTGSCMAFIFSLARPV